MSKRRKALWLPGSLPGSQRGFTLMELIIVILILGVLGAMGSEFISMAFRGFRDTDNRIEMYEEGRLALMRLERELHGALPNAVEISEDNTSISFGAIDESAMAGATVFGMHQESELSGQNMITDFFNGHLPLNALVSIYNTSWDVFADGSRIHRVISDGQSPMTLIPSITTTSPFQRYYAVRNQAIRFVVDEINGTINRETATLNYGAALEAFANPRPLVTNVVRSDPEGFFFYIPGTSSRSALVVIHFALERDGERVNFHKEINVRNVP